LFLPLSVSLCDSEACGCEVELSRKRFTNQEAFVPTQMLL